MDIKTKKWTQEADEQKAKTRSTALRNGKILLANQVEILSRLQDLLAEYDIHIRSASISNNIHFAFPQCAIRLTYQVDGEEPQPFVIYDDVSNG